MTNFETKKMNNGEQGAAIPQREQELGADFDIVAILTEGEKKREEQWQKDQTKKGAKPGKTVSEGGRRTEGGADRRSRKKGEVFDSESEWRELVLDKYFVPSKQVLALYEEAKRGLEGADEIFGSLRRLEKLDDQALQRLAYAVDLQSRAATSWREAKELEELERAEFPDGPGREMWMRDELNKRAAKLEREMEPLEGGHEWIHIPAAEEAKVIKDLAPFLEPQTTQKRKEKEAASKVRRNILEYAYVLERQRSLPARLSDEELEELKTLSPAERRAMQEEKRDELRALSKEIAVLHRAARALDPQKVIDEAHEAGLVMEDYSAIEKTGAAYLRQRMAYGFGGVARIKEELAARAEAGKMSEEDLARLEMVLDKALASPEPEEVLKDALISGDDPSESISRDEYRELMSLLSAASKKEKQGLARKQELRRLSTEQSVKNPEAMALTALIQSSDMPPTDSARLLTIVEGLGDEKDFMDGLRRLVKQKEVSKKDYERIEELKEKLREGQE